jgi:hypothetical protein
MPQKKSKGKEKKKKEAPVKTKTTPPMSKSKGLIPGLGKTLGGSVGGFFGGKPGKWLGEQAGSWLGKITGLGDYKVQSNSLLTNNGPPLFKSQGTTIISHREFLADITGSTDFVIRDYPINPGTVASFPWLSQVARRYEQYELLGIIYEYRGTSAIAVNSTNTALGQVVLSTMYNSAEPTFTNKREMEAYEFTTSCSPAENSIHPVECKSNRIFASNLYVRDQAVPPDADINTYDHGRFSLATVGMQAAAVIGELWVSYHVKLIRPKLESTAGSGHLYVTRTEVGSTGLILSNPTTTVPATGFSTDFTLGNSYFDITVPGAGEYIIQLGSPVTGAAVWTGGFTITNLVNIEIDANRPIYAAHGGAENAFMVASDTTKIMRTWILHSTNANPGVFRITMPSNSSAESFTCSMVIAQVERPDPFLEVRSVDDEIFDLKQSIRLLSAKVSSKDEIDDKYIDIPRPRLVRQSLDGHGRA